MEETRELTYLEIIKFYLPLALAAMIMISSVNVVNSALSKINNSEIAIAAYAIAFSYAQMLSSPCFSGMNMLITLGPDREYYLNTVKFMIKIAFLCLLAVAALAFTPLGDFVAIHLGGATDQLLPGIRSVWRWSLLMPLIFFSIATTRAVLIIERSTYFVTISRFLRLMVMLILAYFLPKFSLLEGAAIGAIIMLGGQASEAFFAAFPAWHYFKKWGDDKIRDIPEKIYPPTQRAAMRFIA